MHHALLAGGGVVTKHDLLEVFLGSTSCLVGTEPHVILFVVFLKRSHNVTAYKSPQGRGDFADAQPELAGFGAIDARLQLRLSVGKGSIEIHNARPLPELCDGLIGVFTEFGEVRTNEVELKIRVAPATANPRGKLNTGTQVWVILENRPSAPHGIELRPAPGLAQHRRKPAPQLWEAAVNEPARHIALAFANTTRGLANSDQGMRDCLLTIDANGLQAGFDLRGNLRGALQGGAFGRLENDLEFAGIVLRHEVEVGHPGQHHHRSHARHNTDNHHCTVIETPSKEPYVIPTEPFHQRPPVRFLVAKAFIGRMSQEP